MSLLTDLGMHPETLRKRVRQAEADEGLRPDLPSTAEREEIKQLRREVFELRRANEILKSASVFFAKGARRRPTAVSRYIDEHRGRFGVEPICRTWTCRLPPTTTARQARALGVSSRISGCSN